MRPGWDPRRRNRNIGTAKQGHGQDNRLIGHYVDWKRSIERGSGTSARSARWKEDFAHRYAAEASASMPRFAPLVGRIRADGLDPAWFATGAASSE